MLNPRTLLGIVFLMLAQPASSQRAPVSEPPTATVHVYTRIVVLDVVVTDAKGQPVTDLNRNDFTVVEDNQPQRIRSFDPPAMHALPPGEIVHSTGDLVHIGNAPVNILVLDELNTPFEDNAFTLYSVQRFLKVQPAVMPPTELLVASDKSFSVLHDFTQKLTDIQLALKHKPTQYPWRLARNGGSGPEAITRLAATLNILEQIAQASAGTPGRKNIIWVGKGFTSVDLTGLDAAARQPLQDAIRRCSDLLLASRVTLYIVDPTPLSSATYDVETPSDLATLESETLMEPFSDAARFSTLAPLTGGRIFRARNDLDQELSTSVQQGALYYTLSYSPSNTSQLPGAYRSVRIALDRPGLTATTRDGYYTRASTVAPAPGSAQALLNDTEEVDDIANAALSRMVYNGVKLRAGKFSPGIYSLAIDGASLAWQPTESGSLSAHLSIVVVSFSSSGKVLAHNAMEKVLIADVATSAQSSQLFTLPLKPPPGTARLRFVVRDNSSNHLGTVDLNQP
ncbi:MAG: VWA domain-containing protein [Acidobacteriaceae bacterium]|nr:VWA domain-containing protein [Acidobacteriaceae bacterium]